MFLIKRGDLIVGDFPEYKKIETSPAQGTKTEGGREKQEIVLNEIDLKRGSYFQGMHPLHGEKGLVGMMAVLLSSQAIWSNTWQMVRLLMLVYLICIILIIPFALFFSYSLNTPIHRVIHSLTDAAEKVSTASFLVSSSSQKLAEKNFPTGRLFRGDFFLPRENRVYDQRECRPRPTGRSFK